MHRGELLGLRWDDVSHNRRVISLALTKNGSSREVPLSPRAFAELEQWRALSNPDMPKVFPFTTGAFEQAWKRLLVREGITGATFHDLRHEAVSRFFERGLNVVEVSTISGHRELRILKRYAHLSADDLVARLA